MSNNEAEIFKIDFSITKNGDIMSVVYISERENFIVFSNNKDNAYNNEFLSTRKKGDKISYVCTNGKYSIIVPEAFRKLYSSEQATGQLMRRQYENFRLSLDTIKNGEKTELSESETENFCNDLIEEKTKFYDIVLKNVSSSSSEYLKLLNSEMGKTRASRKFDPEVIVKSIGDDIHREYSKFYKLAGEE